MPAPGPSRAAPLRNDERRAVTDGARGRASSAWSPRKDAGTILWICEVKRSRSGTWEPRPYERTGLPCPWHQARASIEIEPDGFGGGMGGAGGTRGRKMPAREPLPARCVVIAPSRDAAIAGRSAGMRVVGLCSEAEVTLDGAADVLFDELDDDWDAVTFDDLYTPGSYWVNPPSPRTVDGRHADPWTGEVVEYDMSGAA